MLNLPKSIMTVLTPFRPIFNLNTWQKAQVLLVGAILATHTRTVTAMLRVMGLSQEKQYSKYHQVFNRAVWSPLKLSHTLLNQLLLHLDQSKSLPLVFGIDETIERRWGPSISKRGIYRDAVRSSKSFFVKTSGLRWIGLMWLTPIPWANRIWALPFLTILAPSERFYEKKGKQHKKITDWARQMIYQLRRWIPTRPLVVVADYSYSTLKFLAAAQLMIVPVTIVTRLRLDAALYKPAPPRTDKPGRPRKKGERLPTLLTVLENPKTAWQKIKINWYDGQTRSMEVTSNTAVWYHTGKPPVSIRWVLIRDPSGEYAPIALLSTSLIYEPAQIVHWFVQRWQVEVTFEEVRAHLGVETQRQWSDKAIDRMTPLLMGLFSWITLVAHLLAQNGELSVRQSAWYVKERPTFSDALSTVRQQLWFPAANYSMSASEPDIVKIPSSLFLRLVNTVCYSR
jgi:hypothetical protein